MFACMLPLKLKLGRCCSGYEGICFLTRVLAFVLPLRVSGEMLLGYQQICFLTRPRVFAFVLPLGGSEETLGLVSIVA